MPIPIVTVFDDGLETLYNPFTGKPADDCNDCLFIHLGQVNMYTHVDSMIEKMLKKKGLELDMDSSSDCANEEYQDLGPEALAKLLDIPKCFILSLDILMNDGCNSYCFRMPA